MVQDIEPFSKDGMVTLQLFLYFRFDQVDQRFDRKPNVLQNEFGFRVEHIQASRTLERLLVCHFGQCATCTRFGLKILVIDDLPFF